MIPNVFIKNNGTFVPFSISGPAEFNTAPPIKETKWDVPAHLGIGRFRNVKLGIGMEATFSDCQLHALYQARVEHNHPLITFIFNVSGQTETRNRDARKTFRMTAGDNCIHYFPDPRLLRKSCAQQHLSALVLRITPQRLVELVAGDCRWVPNGLEALLTGKRHDPYFHTGRTTPEMQSAVFQMINCPHAGIVRKIYLESKAMELIAYRIGQFASHAAPDPRHAMGLRACDTEKLQAARDILMRRLQDPPSLPVLAKSVGMSHTKLNRGFRKLYGCTVFDYLRRQRLEYSRMLLHENRMNITEVAFAAGFCSSSHFAMAFTKCFGIPPSAYRNRHSSRG